MTNYSVARRQLAAWSSLALALLGCGSRGSFDASYNPCVPDTAACLSPLLGQICNRQGEWVTFQCPSNQVCQDKSCVGPSLCTPGAIDCVSEQVSQVCTRSGEWITFQCPDGQACEHDECRATATPCEAGASQCVNERISQVCDRQGQWATFACPTGQVCRDGSCTSEVEPCSDGDVQCLSPQALQTCNPQGQWVATACDSGKLCKDGRCQELCTANARECAGERLQRLCLGDGSNWVSSDCPNGFQCSNGECVGSCKPGKQDCATAHILRECRADGAGYVERECLPGTVCSAGKCEADLSAKCSVGVDATCIDDNTAQICKLDGSGYDLVTCSPGTVCRSGRCEGPICPAGTTTCAEGSVSNLTSVRTCSSDGASYTVTLCHAHEQCIFNLLKQKHECYLPPCTEKQSVCGDPNGGQSSTDRLSRCETLSSGKLAWVSYRCTAPAACDVDDAGVARCHADCAPGDQRCSDDDNAIETCGSDGKWSKQNCDQHGSGVDACLVVPTTKAVVCGDPDCNQLQFSLDSYLKRGRCSAEKIRKCGDDGRLRAAVSCEEGMCIPESDDFGTCKDPSRCDHEDEWRECTTDKDAYRTCQSHHWEFTLCSAKQSCADDDQGHAACGDACAPNDRRCSGAGYQTCLSDGTWGSVTRCSTGECNPLTLRCELACQPNELRCVGDVTIASDGSSLGSSAVQICQADGRWGATQACATTPGKVEHCRRSGHGVPLGCVECVGSAVPGGNEENAVDSRCSADAGGVQICTPNNNWSSAATACDSTEQCVKRRDGTVTGLCSDDGCASGSSRRCAGYQTLTTPETIDDCCSGDCQTDIGVCLHRASQYDPTCVETVSCFTGRYDSSSTAIYETCCSGYCRSGSGCLRIKAQPCAAVSSCTVKTLGRTNVCCGSCQTDGGCAKGQESDHPASEYFTCGNSSSLCWNLSSCAWSPNGGSGAMYADCTAKPSTP